MMESKIIFWMQWRAATRFVNMGHHPAWPKFQPRSGVSAGGEDSHRGAESTECEMRYCSLSKDAEDFCFCLECPSVRFDSLAPADSLFWANLHLLFLKGSPAFSVVSFDSLRSRFGAHLELYGAVKRSFSVLSVFSVVNSTEFG